MHALKQACTAASTAVRLERAWVPGTAVLCRLVQLLLAKHAMLSCGCRLIRGCIACRCLPKAARRLNSKNIECEACGLVRAGREQAMAAMICRADTAGAMLHGQCMPEAHLRDAPQMPLTVAPQVSPVMSTAPPPAVAPSVTSPQGSIPSGAYASRRPAAEPGNQCVEHSTHGVPRAGGFKQQPEQAVPCGGPLSRSQPAIKSYSPAALEKQKIPAVTACNVSSDVHVQAMQGARTGHLAVACVEEPTQQQGLPDGKARKKAVQSSEQNAELSSRETSVR